jgi:hypothetical protein
VTVFGQGFTTDSVAHWDGDAQPTAFTSGTGLVVDLGAADLSLGAHELTIVNPVPGGGTSNAFTVTIDAPIRLDFSRFEFVKMEIAPHQDLLKAQGHFTLAANSDGINPLTEPVHLKAWGLDVTVPPGSFKRLPCKCLNSYSFKGMIGDVSLELKLSETAPKEFLLQVNSVGADQSGTTAEVIVLLEIGNDSGTAPAKTKFL